MHKQKSILDSKKRYLQVALNSTLEDAREIIGLLPSSDRIIVEAGTPLIKRYGAHGIRQIRQWYEERLLGGTFAPPAFSRNPSIADIFKFLGRVPAHDSKNAPTDRKTILPYVVIIQRVVDEDRFNREKQIPLHEIRRIKGAYDIMISIAGGDTLREVQRSIFNDADIVVIWKSVFQKTEETVELINGFLKEIK